MNIVTYCSAVAISPTRKYAMGLYVGTLSWENFMKSGLGVLQLLNKNHSNIISLLGTKSGREVNKLGELEGTYGHEVGEWQGIPILSDCSAGILLRASPGLEPIACGDHDLVICDVVEVYQGNKTSPILMTGALREAGVI